MSEVHYYIHGRGRGHAVNSLPIVAALDASGLDVRVFAGAGARAVLEQEGRPAETVDSTPQGVGLRSARTVAARTACAVSAAKRDRPKAVVSDGDLPAVWAARMLGVPALAVGHGLVFAHCERPSSLTPGAWRREARKSTLASAGASRHVAISFAALRARNPRRTVIARPTLRSGLEAREPAGDEVLCYFSEAGADHIAGWVAQLGQRAVLFTARKTELPDVQVHPHDPETFAATLRRARAVVSSAGCQLISECISLGVPQFALHPSNHDEQRLNVEMLRAFDCGAGGELESATREQLEAFFGTLDSRAKGPRQSPMAGLPDAATEVLSWAHSLLAA